MIQAASVLPDASAQHQGGNRRTVNQVVVIPVIDARADNDHALAFGLLSSRGPLARELDDSLAADARPLFLPGRRVRLLFVVVIGRVITRESARDAELRHHQVVDGRNQHAPIFRFDPFRGN